MAGKALVSARDPDITVPEVFRAMGLEPTPDLTWAVGAAVRDRYQERFGHLPEKKLRAKTSGTGSHCFAVYPADWREVIEECIKRVNAAKSAQPDLFEGDRNG
jgi:hypothetical protein